MLHGRTRPSPSSWAIRYARVDLPTPGGPVISRGRRSRSAALTALISSSRNCGRLLHGAEPAQRRLRVVRRVLLQRASGEHPPGRRLRQLRGVAGRGLPRRVEHPPAVSGTSARARSCRCLLAGEIAGVQRGDVASRVGSSQKRPDVTAEELGSAPGRASGPSAAVGWMAVGTRRRASGTAANTAVTTSRCSSSENPSAVPDRESDPFRDGGLERLQGKVGRPGRPAPRPYVRLLPRQYGLPCAQAPTIRFTPAVHR